MFGTTNSKPTLYSSISAMTRSSFNVHIKSERQKWILSPYPLASQAFYIWAIPCACKPQLPFRRLINHKCVFSIVTRFLCRLKYLLKTRIVFFLTLTSCQTTTTGWTYFQGRSPTFLMPPTTLYKCSFAPKSPLTMGVCIYSLWVCRAIQLLSNSQMKMKILYVAYP